MDALYAIPGLPSITVSSVHAYGGTRTPENPRRPDRVESDFTKLEIIAPESMVDSVVNAIGRAGHTGGAGDGIVMVILVEQFVRIRDIDATPNTIDA